MLIILNTLSQEPQTIDTLISKLPQLNTTTLEQYISFLQTLTTHGFVEKKSKGWKLTSYKLMNEIKTSQ